MEFSIDVSTEQGRKELATEAEGNERTPYKAIETSGAYDVTINRAYLKTFNSGSESLEIECSTEDGSNARFSLFVKSKAGKSTYTDKRSGKELPLPSVSQVRTGLMVILKQKNIKPIPMVIDGSNMLIYKCLEGKQIGVVLEVEVNAGKKDPNKKYKNYNLKTFYEVGTRKTGSEILNGTEIPTRVDSIVEGIKDIDNTQSNESKEDFFGSKEEKSEDASKEENKDEIDDFFS